MVECRQRADDAAHDRHRVRIATEAAVEGRELFVQHRVAADRVAERVEIFLRRQFAVEEQIAYFHETRMLGELADRVTAVEQHALVTVNIGDRRVAARGGRETGIVREHTRLGIELADVDNVRTD